MAKMNQHAARKPGDEKTTASSRSGRAFDRLIKAAPLVTAVLVAATTLMTAWMTHFLNANKQAFDQMVKLREEQRDRLKLYMEALKDASPKNLEALFHSDASEKQFAFALATGRNGDVDTIGTAIPWLVTIASRPDLESLGVADTCRRFLTRIAEDIDVKDSETQDDIAKYRELVRDAGADLVGRLRENPAGKAVVPTVESYLARLTGESPAGGLGNNASVLVATTIRAVPVPIFTRSQLRTILRDARELVDRTLENPNLLSGTDMAKLKDGSAALAKLRESLNSLKADDTVGVNGVTAELVEMLPEHLPAVTRSIEEWTRLRDGSRAFIAVASEQLDRFDRKQELRTVVVDDLFAKLDAVTAARRTPLARLVRREAEFVRTAIARMAELK